jgi:hypothetical protein
MAGSATRLELARLPSAVFRDRYRSTVLRLRVLGPIYEWPALGVVMVPWGGGSAEVEVEDPRWVGLPVLGGGSDVAAGSARHEGGDDVRGVTVQ